MAAKKKTYVEIVIQLRCRVDALDEEKAADKAAAVIDYALQRDESKVAAKAFGVKVGKLNWDRGDY